MEFWPGDLVLCYEATTSVRINMQTEVPVLEGLLLASSNPAAPPLADRLAEAEVVHNRSTHNPTPSYRSTQQRRKPSAMPSTRTAMIYDFPELIRDSHY